MEEKNTFTLTLANDKEIKGTINGNNYITKGNVTESDLSDINLIGAELDGTALGDNMTCCNFWEAEDGKHIIFRQKSYEEIQRENLNAKLEYIAMMADIDL